MFSHVPFSGGELVGVMYRRLKYFVGWNISLVKSFVKKEKNGRF